MTSYASQTSDVRLRTRFNEIWIDEEGILNIRSLEITEVDLEEAKACFKIYKQLGLDKQKALQLMDMSNSITITSEARRYAAKHGKDFFIASAIISSSLAVRILVNLFNRVHKPHIPFKMFKSKEEALKWLRKFRK